MMNTEKFSEKAKAVLSYLKESFSQMDLKRFSQMDPSNILTSEISVPEELIDVDGQIGEPNADNESTIIDNGTISSTEDTVQFVPIEPAPNFRIYWRAWKEGNNSSGQTESNLETAQIARAEALSKLYDLGFDNIEILAIETLKSKTISNV